MPRRDYANPPVHEVILDIVFQDNLADSTVEAVGRQLSDRFGFPSRFNTFEFQASIATTGTEKFDASTEFAGWVFEEHDPRWVLRTLRNRITINAARRGDWPRGPYRGWGAIRDRAENITSEIAAYYGGLEIRRMGLRYQNRIAIPYGTELEDWFKLTLADLDVFGDLYSLNLQQTWTNLSEYDDLATTVKLARIAIGEPEIAEDHVGILLDIDVFNPLVENAPSFDSVMSWYDRAHEAENKIFEACITDRLRESFD